MEEQKEPRFYNVEQLSNILGISRSKNYELVSSPDCPFVALKIGKRVCIPANSFYKWYESLVQDTIQKKKIQPKRNNGKENFTLSLPFALIPIFLFAY